MRRSGNTTSPLDSTDERVAQPAAGPKIAGALTIVHYRQQPHRVGESIPLEHDGRCFVGRGDDVDHAVVVRMGAGFLERTGPLEGDKLSRRQLGVEVNGDEVVIENIGNLKMRVNDVVKKVATLEPGDVVELIGHSMFYFSLRPVAIGPIDYPRHDFGGPDAFGMVGESAAMWALRERIAFVARLDDHVLILGPSGTGKEFVALAIHRLSRRARGPYTGCNVAAVPRELFDSEMYGTIRNYPNAGMPERLGFIGSSEGGTLFLDEIGQLRIESQAALLRVLDPNGKFHRLGSATPIAANVRFLCATNKAVSQLLADFAARLTLRLHLPGLVERREDIPLLVRHLVLAAAAASPNVLGSLVHHVNGRDEIDVEPALMTRLVRHPYRTNVRELNAILGVAMRCAHEGQLLLTPDVDAAMAVEATPADDEADKTIDQATTLAALTRHRWNQTRASEALGLSRHQLARLIAKYGLRET
jgi:transcriptional regulator with AAA-type ATPase domain